MKNGHFHVEIIISAGEHARGYAPQLENLEKMCDLVNLGVYFDQILH